MAWTVFDWNPTLRWLRPNLRRAERLAREGTPARARVVGIRVTLDGDESFAQHEFALEVRGPQGTSVAGVRQRLGHGVEEQVRLGGELDVLVDGQGGVLISQDQGDLTRAEVSFKLIDPPDAGIVDANVKPDRKGLPASIEVLSVRRATVFGIATGAVDLDVRVTPRDGAPFEHRVAREAIPFYAQHLVAPGTVLPGSTRPDGGRVRIAWPAAAMADPGVGRPPALGLA